MSAQDESCAVELTHCDEETDSSGIIRRELHSVNSDICNTECDLFTDRELIKEIINCNGKPGSSVSIVTDNGLNDLNSIPVGGQRIFL